MAETFADRLNLLFERARKQGRPLTNEDIERLSNGAITASYVWKLRHWRNTNPSYATVATLSRVFGVSMDFFRGVEDDPLDDAAIRRAIAQPEVRQMVARLGTEAIDARDAARMREIIEVFLRDARQKEEPGAAASDPEPGGAASP